jgi:hypothetical protein
VNDPFRTLTKDEREAIVRRIAERWQCPVMHQHRPEVEYEDCHGCATICVLALLDAQNETGNDATWIARNILYYYFEKPEA